LLVKRAREAEARIGEVDAGITTVFTAAEPLAKLRDTPEWTKEVEKMMAGLERSLRDLCRAKLRARGLAAAVKQILTDYERASKAGNEAASRFLQGNGVGEGGGAGGAGGGGAGAGAAAGGADAMSAVEAMLEARLAEADKDLDARVDRDPQMRKKLRHKIWGRRAEDEDEDIEVMEDDINEAELKCPLSLKLFEHPVRSETCGHVFEREHVTHHLKRASTPFAKCPMSGCNKTFSKADLVLDTDMEERVRQFQQREKLRKERRSQRR